MRDHQGQVHAEPACAAPLRVPPVPHQEQDHQRPRTVHRSPGTSTNQWGKLRKAFTVGAEVCLWQTNCHFTT